MNALMRSDPWSLVPRLQEEINRLFGSVNETGSSAETASWIPAVDIHEYQDRFELFVDLPGVDPDKVDMTLEGGILTICGDRSAMPATAGSGQFTMARTERGQGRFYRRFVLPDTADSENVKASGRNGVLTVTIPKQAKAMPRRIEIAA